MMPVEALLLVLGIVASIMALILFVVLGIIIFRHRYPEPEWVLKPVKVNINRLRLFIIGGIWQMKFLAIRKSEVSSHPQIASLPEGIKVIRQNTTRPLSMYHLPCPNCGRDVRTSAAFCPNCGVSLASPRLMPKPTIDLRPHALEPVSDKLPAIPVIGEPDEEVEEVVHIDLMLKVKLYLLWDRAGR